MMMMMLGGEELKTPEIELSGNIAGNLNVWLTESDYEGEFSNEGLVEEEKLEEIMQELYKEITTTTSSYNTSPPPPPPPPTVTFPSPSSLSSSSSPLSLSSPPLFAVSVSDVKSESCGASMSDSSSTVMAGIEFVGPAGKLPDVKGGLPETGNGLPENELWITGMGFDDNNIGGGEEKMDSCDEGQVGDDDQWLARVLVWGPLELEEWT